MESPQKQIKSLKRRLLTIFSYITGISLGGFMGILLLAVISTAIFVRTETFQTALRDKVARLVSEELKSNLEFERAEVSIFRLEPRIDFLNVKLRHPDSETFVSVKRIGIGMTLWGSLPLLLVRELNLSLIEIEGLSFSLHSLKTIQSWIDLLRPKYSYLPSTFQTSVGRVHLMDVEVALALPTQEFYGEGLESSLNLKSFEVKLGVKEVAFSGELNVSHLKTLHYGPYDGSLSIESGKYQNDFVRFRGLELRRGDDFLQVSGELKRLANPIFDIRGLGRADLAHLPQVWKAEGKLESDFSLRGPWDRLEGEGSAQIKDALVKHKRISLAQGNWKLKYPLLNLESFKWAYENESGEITGSVPLKAGEDSSFSLRLVNADLGSLTGLASNDLFRWRGVTNGKISFQGRLLPEPRGKFEAELHVKDYQIRSPMHDTYSFGLPMVDAQVHGEIDGKRGQFSAEARVGESRLGGGADWDESRFMLRWNSVFAGEFGELLSRKMRVEGTMEASYGGTWDRMVLRAEPRFKVFELDHQVFTNLKGQLILADRILSGSPLIADQISVQGGVFFPEKKDEEFYNLRINTSGVDLQFLFRILNVNQTWAQSLRGDVYLNASLRGLAHQPIGSGRVEFKNWSLRGDATKGRVAKAKWASAGGDLYLDQVELALAEGAERLMGEASFDPQGLVDMSFEGHGIKMSNLLYLLNQDWAVQGLADISFDYNRASPSLKASTKIYKTSFGGQSHQDSKITLSWVGDQLQFNADLLGGSILASGQSVQRKKTRETKAKVQVVDLNLASLFRAMNASRLEIPLRGHGEVQLTQVVHEGSLLSGLFSTPGDYQGELTIDNASIEKSGTILATADPFTIKLGGRQVSLPSLDFSLMRLRSQDKVFESQGYYRKSDEFSFSLKGKLDLRAIAALFQDFSRCEGVGQIEGIWSPNGFVGYLSVSEGLVAIQYSPMVVRSVKGELISDGRRAQLKNFQGNLRDGTLKAEGDFFMGAQGIEAGSIRLNLENTLLQPFQGLQFQASGPMELKIKKGQGEIVGRMNIRDGLFRRRIDAKADMLTALKADKLNVKAGNESFWQSLKLNFDLVSQEPFVVRNNLVEGEANLNLKILGTLSEPHIKGSVGVIRGQFNYNNRQFQIRSGSVQFSDPISNIPSYDIRADTEVSDYRVYLQFLGDSRETKIRYSSDPALNEKDILSLLSFGYRSSDPELRNQDPTRSASIAGLSFFTGNIQDRIEREFSSGFGIQRFSILPAFYEQTGKTELQLTVGADIIRNKLLVNYSNFLSATGGHKIELEYKVNRMVYLIGAWRSVEGQSADDLGGDLRLRFEFE